MGGLGVLRKRRRQRANEPVPGVPGISAVPLVSLLASDGQRPYEAFLYPFFVQQEQGGARTPFLDLWKGSTSARTPEQLDDRLDALLGFAAHFRDFTVRNFNSSIELPPTERHYQSQDSAIPLDEKPNILLPTVVLAQPAKLSRPATLQPLTAQYERYQVGAAVRYVRIDASTLANSAFVDFDALANVRGTWQRRKGKGTVLEFCRDDAADDIQELYLVVTSRDRRRGQQVSGGYTVDARATCPAGWTGVLRYVLTIDDVGAYSDANEAYTRDNHFRTEETWSFVGSTPAPAPDSFDTVDATWRGSLLRTDLETDIPMVCLSNTALFTSIQLSGLGSGSQQFIIVPLDEDPKQVYVSQNSNQFGEITGTGSRHDVYCLSGPLDTTLPILWTEGVSVLVNSLSFLVPDPGDPDHYAGKRIVSHYETPSLGDGMRIYEDYVEWDIRRRRAP